MYIRFREIRLSRLNAEFGSGLLPIQVVFRLRGAIREILQKHAIASIPGVILFRISIWLSL